MHHQPKRPPALRKRRPDCLSVLILAERAAMRSERRYLP
jgi:hypothetical protein